MYSCKTMVEWNSGNVAELCWGREVDIWPSVWNRFILYAKHVAILWVSVLKGYTHGFQYRNVKCLRVTVNPYGGQGHVCND